MARYKPGFLRDWAFYTSNLDYFSFSGSAPPAVAHDPHGPDAQRAFHAYDSRGVLVSTSEPDLLRRVLVCKASVNLHIRMWAEGIAEGTMWPSDLAQVHADTDAPAWVFEAAWRQAWKRRRPPQGLPTALDVVRVLCAPVHDASR
jgi:hypothetical protein